MSRFDTDFAVGGLPQLMYEYGQSVTYLPVGFPSVTLQAIVRPEESDILQEANVRSVDRKCIATITDNPDSDDGGVATPSEAASVTISDVEWAIDSIDQVPGGWRLTLVRSEATEYARPGFRGKMT